MIWGLSFTKIASVLFLAYMFNNFWQMYKLFTPETCSENEENLMKNCYLPSLRHDVNGDFELVQLRVYISQRNDNLGQLAMSWKDLQISQEISKSINVTIPKSVSSNGYLYAHVLLVPQNFEGVNPMTAPWKVHAGTQMIVFQEPVAKAFNLLGEEKPETAKKTKKPITLAAHFRSILPIRIATDSKSFKIDAATHELRDVLTIVENGPKHEYLPMLFVDEMSMRSRDLIEISENADKMNLTIDYQPTSVAKLLLLTTTARTIYQLTKHGFKDKDIDELRGLFTETSLVLLMVTFFVSTLHLLFDALAFKNDISFWKGRDSMVGLSSKTLLWRCFSQTIIFFYLHDQNTSLLVLIPAGVSTVIEYWKITIAYKITFSFRTGISFGKHSSAENETDSIDSQAMKYLSIFLIPLVIAGSIYSLMYVPHKSWKSWLLQTSSNGVYAFGFLFMLPQLFVNYKLKSVAHLPWRAFMYKAFNTFIDDLFAFIITMPTAHRMACFRDDIVFVIYLYQRWLYPVDYSRPNEYGETETKEKEEFEKTEKSRKAKKVD